jgi:hypothetical protein
MGVGVGISAADRAYGFHDKGDYSAGAMAAFGAGLVFDFGTRGAGGAARRGSSLLKADEEVFQQALMRDAEVVQGFRIFGNKGLAGNTFNRNIFLIEAERKGAVPLRSLANAFEQEARAAGATRLSIMGHAVINPGFMSPAIAQRFGFVSRPVNDYTIHLTKDLGP